jgi:hypothetical protein
VDHLKRLDLDSRSSAHKELSVELGCPAGPFD